MKAKLFALTYLVLSYALTQVQAQDYPKFILTHEGVAPIVVEFDSMSASTLYGKAEKWVRKTYKDPAKVLKATLPAEELRLEGYKETAYFYKTFGKAYYYDLEYTFQIEFKDKKIRLSFIPGQSWYNGTRVYDYKTFFKKTGELKDAYKDTKPSFEDSMNELVNSLCNYLNGRNMKDDW